MKLPRRPTKFQIGGVNWKILYVKGLRDKQGSCGMCLPDSAEIHIDTALPVHVVEATLFHELVEACKATLELRLPHKDLQALSSMLHQIIGTLQ